MPKRASKASFASDAKQCSLRLKSGTPLSLPLVHLGGNSLPVFDRRPLTADGGLRSAVGGLDCCLIYAVMY